MGVQQTLEWLLGAEKEQKSAVGGEETLIVSSCEG